MNNTNTRAFGQLAAPRIKPMTYSEIYAVWTKYSQGDKTLEGELVQQLEEKNKYFMSQTRKTYFLKEKIPVYRIPEYATFNFFVEYGFHGLITAKFLGFNSSPYAAVDNAYHGLFRREQFYQKLECQKHSTSL